MEAVTAVKIQIVYDKLLNIGYPLTPNARETKNKTKVGPDAKKFPEKINRSETMRNSAAKINANR